MAAQDSADVEHGAANDAGATSAASIDLTRKESPDDRVAQFVAEHQNYPPMTPEMEKRIKKKIDAWIIPLVRIPSAYTRAFHIRLRLASRVSSLLQWQLSTRFSCPRQHCTTSSRITTCQVQSLAGSEASCPSG